MQASATRQPQRPTHLSGHAEVCLEAVASEGLGDQISLGGALGLLHYLDYRPTHDVDAWWSPAATEQHQKKVIRAVEHALKPYGQVRIRAWGDVVSIELMDNGIVAFSFQIARRSAQLYPPEPAPWTDVLLESFPDLVASKMVALVERGAPRDFRDIYAVCEAGLTTPVECWQWWKERQRRSDSDTDAARASLAVETHLARIAQHRPLADIDDVVERSAAETVRAWFSSELLDALVD